MAKSPITNAFTIDFEDWYQAFEIFKVDSWHKFESRIERNCQRMLEILKTHDVKATFFVLGYLADNFPELIRCIHELGHEIGSHSYSHLPVVRISPSQFNEEISRTNEAVRKITGKNPIGFRAPMFSIIDETNEAFDILAKNGIRYDSSIHPTLQYRFGIIKADRFRHEITTVSRKKIVEIPVTTARMFGANLPVGGGAYFRLWPYWFTKWSFQRVNNQGRPAVFYFHPWEFDSEQPKIDVPWKLAATHYHRLASTEKKLHKLLTDFKFSTMSNVFDLGY
jgi:polysaccharide deacetylase family protein (PEP-CTERM system associated)